MRIVTPRLEYTDRFINTTGDLLDPTTSLVIPKAKAQIQPNAAGQDCLVLLRDTKDGPEQAFIPREAFQESPGPHGVFYLPTYSDSPVNAALRGGIRGLFSLGNLSLSSGLLGGVAGAAGGIVGSQIPINNRPLKMLAGAATGAAVLAGTQALLGGTTSLPVTLMLGAVTGVTGVLGGAGEGQVRDGLTGGMLTGVALGVLTGNPFLTATSGIAAGLGAHAKSPAVRAATAAAAGAAMGAAEALLTHNPLALSMAITAAAGGLGAVLGPVLMQATRNLSEDGASKIRTSMKGWASRQNDTTMTALGAVPGALSGALLGSAAAAIHPSWMIPGAAVGAAVLASLGVVQTHRLIADYHKQEAAALKNPTPKG